MRDLGEWVVVVGHHITGILGKNFNATRTWSETKLLSVPFQSHCSNRMLQIHGGAPNGH